MMISPKTFAESFKDESLETCLKEKERLQKEIEIMKKKIKIKSFHFLINHLKI